MDGVGMDAQLSSYLVGQGLFFCFLLGFWHRSLVSHEDFGLATSVWFFTKKYPSISIFSIQVF